MNVRHNLEVVGGHTGRKVYLGMWPKTHRGRFEKERKNTEVCTESPGQAKKGVQLSDNAPPYGRR